MRVQQNQQSFCLRMSQSHLILFLQVIFNPIFWIAICGKINIQFNKKMECFLKLIYIIIAVMDLKRQPYLRKFKKDNEQAIAKKIKELQMAAELQRNQTKSFLVQDQTQPTQAEIISPPPTTSARTIKLQTNQTTPTARRKQKCDENVQNQVQVNILEPANEPKPRGKPPLPLPALVIPGRQEDNELEYLKSDQYKKYLDKLTQAYSKQDKAKVIKENRNHNVYLGKDRKEYIQTIIKTKEVLPRVKLQFMQSEPEEYNRKQAPNPCPEMLVDSYMYNEREIIRKPISTKKMRLEPTRKEIQQQSPIRNIKKQIQIPFGKEKFSYNGTIILSPVCQKYQRQQPKKQSKQITLFFQNIQAKGPQNQNAKNSPYHSKPVTPKSKPYKCQTYRKQFEFLQKQNRVTQRTYKQQQRQQKRNCWKNKKSHQYKQNHKKKRLPTPSPSSSSQCSDRSAKNQNIYDISFKIDMPAFKKREYCAAPKEETRNPLKQYIPSYNMRKTPQKPTLVKHSQPLRQKIFTQYSYQPYTPQFSQANSAITRQQNHSQSRSPHKISVISRSKHRRMP